MRQGSGIFGWHLTGHDELCPIEGPTGLRCTHETHGPPSEGDQLKDSTEEPL